uniref:Uncharacterized protein n=1 Tax=Solanum lycopersicum TaxID=4081 RepID=A0A3Q7GVE7_SOLLC
MSFGWLALFVTGRCWLELLLLVDLTVGAVLVGGYWLLLAGSRGCWPGAGGCCPELFVDSFGGLWWVFWVRNNWVVEERREEEGGEEGLTEKRKGKGKGDRLGGEEGGETGRGKGRRWRLKVERGEERMSERRLGERGRGRVFSLFFLKIVFPSF